MTLHIPSMSFVLGLPGAGKSEFLAACVIGAKPTNLATGVIGMRHRLISFDHIRKALGHEYHAAAELTVLATACIMARVALWEGEDVIVDESITLPHVAGELVAVAREFSAPVTMIHIPTPEHVCWERREDTDFPPADFGRKVREWEANRDAILGMADSMHTLANGGFSA